MSTVVVKPRDVLAPAPPRKVRPRPPKVSRGLLRLGAFFVVLALVATVVVIWTTTHEAAEPEPTVSPSVEPSVEPSVVTPPTTPTTPPTEEPGLGILIIGEEFYLEGRLVRFEEINRLKGDEPFAVAFRLPEGTVIMVPFAGERAIWTVSAGDPLTFETDMSGVSVYEGSYGTKKGLLVSVAGPALQPRAGEGVRRGDALAVIAYPEKGLPIPGLHDYNVLLTFSRNQGPNGLGGWDYENTPKVMKLFFPYLFER